MSESEAKIQTEPKKGRFPRFRDNEHEDWKLLIEENGTKIHYRISHQDRKRLDVSIKAPKRQTVVSRRIREILHDHQHVFGLQGAGVTPYGGCLPLYGPEDDGDPVAYQQDYRYTLRVV